MKGHSSEKKSGLPELGGQIRALRKQKKLSLEALSARSQVALATLSRIENGKAAGTFRTHQRIAEALGVSLPQMYQTLESAQETPLETATQEAETFTYDKKSSAVLLARHLLGKQMLPQLILLEPDGKTTEETFSLGTERWLFCLEGTAVVQVGENQYKLTQGDTLYFKASLPHQFTNQGKAPARLISVTSPSTL